MKIKKFYYEDAISIGDNVSLSSEGKAVRSNQSNKLGVVISLDKENSVCAVDVSKGSIFKI